MHQTSGWITFFYFVYFINFDIRFHFFFFFITSWVIEKYNLYFFFVWCWRGLSLTFIFYFIFLKMVKRAELIYQLLRNETSNVGQSIKDIMNKMSENYGVTAGKGIKRQIRAALKRGVEFGALTRRYNRYRFVFFIENLCLRFFILECFVFIF